MRNSNRILQFFLDRLIKTTKKINTSILQGKRMGKTDQEILFQISMELIETENDLKEDMWYKIECFFEQCQQEKLPAGIVRLELESDCPELLFLN